MATIRRFDTAEPVIVLTFDAGADRGFAATILDTLAAKGVRASFGLTGTRASANPDLVQRMAREGHHLLNHTWSHRSFTGRSTGSSPLSTAERTGELRRTEELIRQLTGVELRAYFRPPYGEFDDSVLSDLAANGYTLNVMWTIDSLGWRGLTADEITRRVLDVAGPGAIVLMHVGNQSQDAAALSEQVDQLRARGYRFATVRDLVEGRFGPEFRYFPETGYWVGHGFLRYWERFGGLAVYGYPILEEFREVNPDDRREYTVQYFERGRFEWHPGAWPERYDVLLGRLAAQLLVGRGWSR